jgi:thiol-disulfide isomerase/thioredoxin
MRFNALIALLIFLYSCNQKDEITLYGKILNPEITEIILEGTEFIESISLDADGLFSLTTKIPYNGIYILNINEGNNYVIYLENGFDLKINANTQDIENAIEFSGKGAKENNLRMELHHLKESVFGGSLEDWNTLSQLYSLPEEQFIDIHEKFKQATLEKITESNIKNKLFLELATKDTEHHLSKMYFYYPNYHRYFTTDDNMLLSDRFPTLDASYNLDDGASYQYSLAYRDLITAAFQEKIYEKDSETTPLERGFEYISTLKTPYIINSLLEDLSYEFKAERTLQQNYEKFLQYSSSDKFRENITNKYEKLKNLIEGMPSPTFDYENFAGGTSSLQDFKGKYVYIDVWATWCGPCIKEIPALQSIEKQYHGKNIDFISISIDQPAAKEKWKNMITDKNMSGVQLFADNAWESEFVVKYNIEGIPRFILIDTEGNIIQSDALRPSDPALVSLLDGMVL